MQPSHGLWAGLGLGSGLLPALHSPAFLFHQEFVLLTKAADKWVFPVPGSSFKFILRRILHVCVFACLLTQIKPTRVSIGRGAAAPGDPAGTL